MLPPELSYERREKEGINFDGGAGKDFQEVKGKTKMLLRKAAREVAVSKRSH